MQMMDAIKKNTPATRIKPRYKSVGSPPFTEKKCSIFHKSSGLKIIKKLNRSKRISPVSYTHLLLSGSMEERASVVAEYGKEVRKIEQRISEFTASHPAGRHERSRSLSAGAER